MLTVVLGHTNRATCIGAQAHYRWCPRKQLSVAALDPGRDGQPEFGSGFPSFLVSTASRLGLLERIGTDGICSTSKLVTNGNRAQCRYRLCLVNLRNWAGE